MPSKFLMVATTWFEYGILHKNDLGKMVAGNWLEMNGCEKNGCKTMVVKENGCKTMVAEKWLQKTDCVKLVVKKMGFC